MDAGEQPPAKESARFMHGAAVTATALSPDGKLLATGGGFRDGCLRLWDVATTKELHELSGHGGGVSAVAFSPDGKHLASAGWDGEAMLHEVATGKKVRDLRSSKAGISSLCYAADGGSIALATTEGIVYLHDPATGREVRHLEISRTPRGRETVVLCALSPDGATLLTLVRSGDVRAWNVAKEKELWRRQMTEEVLGVIFSPNGRMAALETSFEMVGLIEVSSGQVRAWLGRKRGKATPVIAPRVAFSPDGCSLLSCLAGREVVFWDLPTGQKREWQTPLDGFVNSLAYGGDGRVACGRHDGIVEVREAPPAGERKPVKELSPDLLDGHWSTLASVDASSAYQSMQALTAAPGQSLPYIAKRVQPVPAVDPNRLTQLVEDLDSNRFAVRQKASVELERLGETAAKPLREALKARPALETARRIEKLLALLEAGLAPERLRTLRTIEALEAMRSVDALPILEKLAAGAPGVRETEDAAASVARLKRHAKK